MIRNQYHTYIQERVIPKRFLTGIETEDIKKYLRSQGIEVIKVHAMHNERREKTYKQ